MIVISGHQRDAHEKYPALKNLWEQYQTMYKLVQEPETVDDTGRRALNAIRKHAGLPPRTKTKPKTTLQDIRNALNGEDK